MPTCWARSGASTPTGLISRIDVWKKTVRYSQGPLCPRRLLTRCEGVAAILSCKLEF